MALNPQAAHRHHGHHHACLSHLACVIVVGLYDPELENVDVVPVPCCCAHSVLVRLFRNCSCERLSLVDFIPYELSSNLSPSPAATSACNPATCRGSGHSSHRGG